MAKANIPMHAMILRCVWETKSLHTIFSYVFISMSNYTRCGKTLAHCFYNISSEIYDSIPPTLDDIQTESEKVQLFVNYLLVQNTGIHNNTELNHILAASILIFNDEFLGIIVNEPSGKNKDTSHHPFHPKIASILFELKIHMKPLIIGRNR